MSNFKPTTRSKSHSHFHSERRLRRWNRNSSCRHHKSSGLAVILVTATLVTSALYPAFGNAAGAGSSSALSAKSSRFLPRSPTGRSGTTNRQRLDALLEAELSALEKKLEEEQDPGSRKEIAAIEDQVKKQGSEKLSRKRGESSKHPDVPNRDSSAFVGASSSGDPEPRSAGLTDTVAKLADEIEISKLKEAVLEEKLNKLELRLEEESLAKALLLARVPSLFGNDRSGTSLLEIVNDEEPLITKGDVTDYCHFNALKHCGFRALKELGKMDTVPPMLMDASAISSRDEKTTSPNDLPIWERCQIKDDFLSCMIARKQDPCEPDSKATLSRKAFREFRQVLMKSLQQAMGCWLPK